MVSFGTALASVWADELLVVFIAVVDGYLFAFFDIRNRRDDDAAVNDFRFGVGVAGMIDVSGDTATVLSVYRPFIVYFKQVFAFSSHLPL